VDLPNFAAIRAMLFAWFSTGLQFYFIVANLYHWDILEWFRPGGSSEGYLYCISLSSCLGPLLFTRYRYEKKFEPMGSI